MTPWLKSNRTFKFMGKQDQMAVVAAGRAARAAGVTAEKAGLYLAVGHIPFERDEVESLARNSAREGAFSMEQFSTVGLDQVNPLLTFRCLPNMPLFHVSLNLGITGPYFIAYPGVAQFYLALEEARLALEEGSIDQALVGGVADQNNFLVDFHFRRLGAYPHRRDLAAFLCLERRQQGLVLVESQVSYGPPLEPEESFHLDGRLLETDAYEGPASLAAAIGRLSEQGSGVLDHWASTLDGFRVSSRWRWQ